MLPKEYPKWELAYYYFRRCTRQGHVEEIYDLLWSFFRKKAKKQESPSLGLLDNQSVKTSSITTEKGYAAGRKRQIIMDTKGFILAIVIHNANIQDRDGTKIVIKELQQKYLLLKKVLADGAYGRSLIEWTLSIFALAIEIVSKVVGTSPFEKVIVKCLFRSVYVLNSFFIYSVNFGKILNKYGFYSRLVRKFKVCPSNGYRFILSGLVPVWSLNVSSRISIDICANTMNLQNRRLRVVR
jgi:transposase